MTPQVEQLSEPRWSVISDERKAEIAHMALVVIPVHEALSHTIGCLESLLSESATPPILVIDNGSSDATADAIRAKFPQVEMIRQPNLGYSAAANVGILESQKRGCKYTWLLNSDTVVTSDALQKLVAFMEDPVNLRVGACSPVIVSSYNPPVIDFAGGLLNRSNWSTRHINDPVRGDLQLRNHPLSSFLMGCALLVRNSAAVEVGMFDVRFFLYWEDCEFCIRLVDHGWQLRMVLSATVLHKVHGSSRSGQSASPIATYYGSRNCFLLWRLYTKGVGNKVLTFPRILQWIVQRFISRRVNPLTNAKVGAVEGVVDGLAGRYGQKSRSLGRRQAQILALVLWYFALPWRLANSFNGSNDQLSVD